MCGRLTEPADGGSVFGGRHTGPFFKLSGEVMDRGVAQGIGYLGDVLFSVPEHLSGSIGLSVIKIVNDPTAGLVSKQLLKAGTSDQVVVADTLDRQRTVDVVFQIGCKLGEQECFALRSVRGWQSACGGQHKTIVRLYAGRNRRMISAEKLDEQLLQIHLDKLFAGERGIFSADQFLAVGIVQTVRKGQGGFPDDRSQKLLFRRADVQYFIPEKVHSGGDTFKADDDQIGGDDTVGIDIVKFSRFMEDYITLKKCMGRFAGQNVYRALIHT